MSAKARRGSRAPLALVLALAALLALPVGASAVHWPNFGGDAGRSGDQPVEAGTVPVKSVYRKNEAGLIRTSIITSAGGPATVQRMIYGAIQLGSSGNRLCNIHMQILATGAPVGSEAGTDICTANDDATEENAFGTAAVNGSVTPVESSSANTLGQIFAVHNDLDAAPVPEGTGGACDVSDNDIAIAQIDETDATLVRDIAVGGASRNPANPNLPALCGNDSTAANGKQITADFSIESSPVLTPVLNPPGNDRALFFLAKRSTDNQVRLFKVAIGNASSKAATMSFSAVDVTGGNHLASPSIAYLQDPERPGTIAPYVVVPMQSAGAGGLATYRVSDLVPGPFVAAGTAGTAGIPQTPASPVTNTGAVPGSSGSGVAFTPFIYLAYEIAETTVVRKFRQQADSNVLEPVGDPSIALDGKPSRALALRQEVVDGTPQANGRLVVATAKNLFVLNTDSLGVAAAMQDAGEVALSGAAGFARTVPAVSGDLIYISRGNGNQLVVRLSDAERVCAAGDLRPECSEDEFTEAAGNSGGAGESPSTFSIGQPSISRGFVQFASDRGAFVYKSTSTSAQSPPVVDITAPADKAKVSGNAVTITAKATDPDNLGITKVEFFIDPGTNPPCNPAFADGKLGEDTTPSGDNEYSVTFDSTKCADRFYTITARATDAGGQTSTDAIQIEINNIANPTASFTVAPDTGPSGTEFTFDASASAPAATPADQAITKYEWDWEGDGTYDLETTEKVVKHTYATPAVYSPTLRVTQTNGQTETATKSVTVTNRPPIASFVANPNPAQANQAVAFDGSASSDPDGSITKYEWDFDGDNAYDQTTTTAKTSFTYKTAGKRTARLRVTDSNGDTNTVARDIEVGGPNVPPTASFTSTPNPAAVNAQVTFDGSASRDSDGSIVKYEWDLDGNGAFETNSGANPRTQRAYAVPAVYNVKLRVTDNSGTTTETVRQLTVTGTAVISGRKVPRSLSITVKPKRDRTLPYVFKTSGRLSLPSGVTRTAGCTGRVTITVKVGKKTISRRTTALRTGCTYSSSVTFRDRKRLGTAKSVRIVARFQGNKALSAKSSRTFRAYTG